MIFLLIRKGFLFLTNLTIWNGFTRYYSSTSTQQYLQKCYQKLSIINKETKSYNNCYPFIYYLEHGQTYFTQARNAPLSIQPILLFYGCLQLIKACLLTIDPDYPDTTSVLAHGVTTRKRKKQQYSFLQDEVKTQKNGLFSHMSWKMFHMKQLEHEKFSMEQLIQEIPEMQHIHSKKTFEKLSETKDHFELPLSLLDTFQMTSARLGDYLTAKTKSKMDILPDKLKLNLVTEEPFTVNHHSPIHFNLIENTYMLSLNKQSPCYLFPELLNHYLILYNLSMICRYETEWWYELQKTVPTDDYPAIVQYVQISQEKIPFLILQWLTNISM